MHADDPSTHPGAQQGPARPAEPHDPDPLPPPRRCAWATTCECGRGSMFCYRAFDATRDGLRTDG